MRKRLQNSRMIGALSTLSFESKTYRGIGSNIERGAAALGSRAIRTGLVVLAERNSSEVAVSLSSRHRTVMIVEAIPFASVEDAEDMLQDERL